MRKTLIITSALVALAAIAARPETSFVAQAQAACDPGDRIDGTTAADTRKKLEQAGYKSVTKIAKGCDNYWHADAVKDGAAVHVALSPQGQILSDGTGY